MKPHKAEARVQNPFGGGSFHQYDSSRQASSSFGTPQSNPFHQPSRLNPAWNNPTPRNGKGKGKGSASQGSSLSMLEDIDDSSGGRVSNPFAVGGKEPLSLQEAVSQFKCEYLKKKGYPFSCFGRPGESPVIHGDISPHELRYYLSQGTEDIKHAINERSHLLNADFTDFIRWALPGGTEVRITRSGPYRIPDPEFPPFVPRTTFSITSSPVRPDPSARELEAFKSNSIDPEIGIPVCIPPLELR